MKIEELRKRKGELIGQIKWARKKIAYKTAEADAINKFLEMEHIENSNAQRRELGTLIRQKKRLEFKISTETFSLSDEKELIRKIKDVDKTINELMRIVRFFRKKEFIKGDLEELNAQTVKLNTDIGEIDVQLDKLYMDIGKLLHIGERSRPQHTQQRKPERKQMSQEVNLEDIVVIKKKK